MLLDGRFGESVIPSLPALPTARGCGQAERGIPRFHPQSRDPASRFLVCPLETQFRLPYSIPLCGPTVKLAAISLLIVALLTASCSSTHKPAAASIAPPAATSSPLPLFDTEWLLADSNDTRLFAKSKPLFLSSRRVESRATIASAALPQLAEMRSKSARSLPRAWPASTTTSAPRKTNTSKHSALLLAIPGKIPTSWSTATATTNRSASRPLLPNHEATRGRATFLPPILKIPRLSNPGRPGFRAFRPEGTLFSR